MAYGQKQFEMMKKLKGKIIATHVHDNTGKLDAHTLPYIGNTDWSDGLKALAEIGYEGDLTFELAYLNIPDELAVDFLKYAHKTGEHMHSLFESYKQELGR